MLSEFRAWLIAGSLELKILDLLLGRLKGLGLVKAGGMQRTDSTHVLARIRSLSRLELAGESVRAALEALAAAAPGWLASVIDASWQQVYGQRADDFRLPADESAARSWPCSTARTATTCWRRRARRALRRGWPACPPSRRCG